MSTGSTLLTVSGGEVDFLPLPTPWPSGDGCSGYKYRQIDGHFLAWDPFYGLSLDNNARTCLPSQVSSWWFQSDTATSTALGPTFVCPEAYYAVQTALIATSTQQVYCCPSGYSLYVPQPNTPSAFPSQCTSTVNPGETISFMSLFEESLVLGSTTTSSTVQSEVVTVYGIPVNGFNIAQSTSTAASTSDATRRTGASSASTPSNTSAQTSSAAASGSSGPSLGVSVGVSIGCVFAALLLALGGFLLWRRRRRRLGKNLQPSNYAELQGSKAPSGPTAELQGAGVKPELYTDNYQHEGRMYELPGYGQPER